MKAVIIGHRGEVGGALYEILSKVYEVKGVDLEGGKEVEKAAGELGAPFDVMHVCIRHGDNFLDIVRGYAVRFQPRIVDVCTTVPPGTIEQLGPAACHSSTRGAHPNLAQGLATITKHISGPKAEKLARYYRKASVPCTTNVNVRTGEVNHDLNNAHYGLNLFFADVAARYHRRWGTDYLSYMDYTRTNNAGFADLGHDSKVRPVLTPPGGRIGGHCVLPSLKRLIANMDPGDRAKPILEAIVGLYDQP